MDTTAPRRPYDSDVGDEEWAFLAPYLTLMREDAPQRTHPLRELFNGLRYIARTGLQWRFMPHDLPPGTRSTNKPAAGWMPGCSRPSLPICGA